MRKPFQLIFFTLFTFLAVGETCAWASGSNNRETELNIRLIVDGETLTAALNNTPAARAFAALLPLDVTLEDFHATEKVADLPSRLPTGDAPEGYKPRVGDITYYAPWGNLALFYRDFGYSKGLVSLGHIQGPITVLERRGPLTARIEQVIDE